MINADHAAMVDGDILLFNLPQSAYIYRKSRTAHAPSNFLEVGVRLLETGEDAAIGDRNFRSRLYLGYDVKIVTFRKKKSTFI